MGDNLLDALVDSFIDNVENNDVGRRSSDTEKSMLYKSAVEDQTWLHVDDDNEGTECGIVSPVLSENTPTIQRTNEKEMLSFSALEREMHESYAELPPLRDASPEKQLSLTDIETEMDIIRKRFKQLEEEKERLTRSQASAAAERKKPSHLPVVSKPAAQEHALPKPNEESVLDKGPSDAVVSKAAARVSRKRKSVDNIGSSQNLRRNILPPAAKLARHPMPGKGQETEVPAKRTKFEEGLQDKRNCDIEPYDIYFRIRIQNTKIAPLTFQGYVGDRQKIRISELTAESQVNWNDWVTMAVVVDKTPLRTSSKGSSFSIWQLSDLLDCQRVVRLLLFGDSATGLWKLNKGDVVAIVNAKKMANSTGGTAAQQKRNVLTIKVDSKQNIVELGSCPDYGLCKGTRTLNNLHCSNFVNNSNAEYCEFHLVSASKRLASKRGEIQLASNVPPKKFNRPVKNVLPGRNLCLSRLPIGSGVASTSGVSTAGCSGSQPKQANSLANGILNKGILRASRLPIKRGSPVNSALAFLRKHRENQRNLKN